MPSRHRTSRLKSHEELFVREGFLILPAFFDSVIIDTALSAVNRVKNGRPLDVVIDNLENGERTVLGLMSAVAIAHTRMKINDLYLREPAMREMALAEDLVEVLRALFGSRPALCNSIYFETGSTQEMHVDTLYMTPRTPQHLIATWIALEDAHADAGQLEYIPRSHLIAPMRFSDGGYHSKDAEMPAWRSYINAEVAMAGLKKTTFSAQKGDVFIWHANLLHGGAAIRNFDLTRRSCVFHYFSEQDAQAGGYRMMPLGKGYWIDRPPQPLPRHVVERLPFSENTYLARYPDIAAAVKAGSFANGKHHYELFGREEGRLPC